MPKIQCNIEKAIIANILARVAREFNLSEIENTCQKTYTENKVLNDKFETLRTQAVNGRIAYNILDQLYALLEQKK